MITCALRRGIGARAEQLRKLRRLAVGRASALRPRWNLGATHASDIDEAVETVVAVSTPCCSVSTRLPRRRRAVFPQPVAERSDAAEVVRGEAWDV